MEDDVFDDADDTDDLDNSSEDSDLPPVPTFLSCVTPKKKNPDRDLSLTPDLHILTPDSSFTFSPIHFSPIHFSQQSRGIEPDEQQKKREARLLDKSRKCFLNMKEKKERRDTITEVTRAGGVLEISRQMDKNIEEVEEKISAGSIPEKETDQYESQHQDRKVDIPKVPGVPFFITPPIFFKNFQPFPPVPIHQSVLSRIVDDIKNFTIVHQLLFIVNGKECPSSIIIWLMENACLSEDIMIRHIASNTLAQILSISSSLSAPLCIKDFLLILTKLGANCNLSAELQNSVGICDRSPTSVELLLNSVSNFCKSILVLFKRFGSIHSDFPLIRDLVITLLNIALDPLICSDFVYDDVSICLHQVINTASVEHWPLVEQEILSQFKSISNHQNCHFITTLLSSFSPRISILQHSLARTYLTKFCPPCGELSDHQIAHNTVDHYIQAGDVVYNELLSTMKMLAIFILSMKWNGDHAKKDFVSSLKMLVNRVRDNMPGVAVERGPVKDFIIGLTMELEHSNSRETNDNV